MSRPNFSPPLLPTFLLLVLLLSNNALSEKWQPNSQPNPQPHLPFNSRQANAPLITPRNLSDLISEANKTPLTISEKRRIISTIARFMAHISPHRFLQLNLLKVDIVKELTAFSKTLHAPQHANQTNVDFHEHMTHIMQKMNDKHSVYLKPPPFLTSFATLGFRVNDFFVPGQLTSSRKPRRRYAAQLPDGATFDNQNFRSGSEIVAWDGEAIGKVVRRLGRDSTGSNVPAQISTAMFLLSIRYLMWDPIPFAKSAVVSFRNDGGPVQNVAVPWQFVQVEMDDLWANVSERMLLTSPGARPCFDKRLLMPTMTGSNQPTFRTAKPGLETIRTSMTRKTIDVVEEFAGVFTAEVVTTRVGDIGRLFLPSFGSQVTGALINELTRVLRLMPARGLIIDIRDNEGGHSEYVKAVLELTSEKDVHPQPMSIRASDLMAKLFKQKLVGVPDIVADYVNTFRNSGFDTARRVGETFSGPIEDLFTIVRPPNTILPRRKRAYYGPVVTVYNGLTVSAGDIFASIQIDQNRSLVVGTSDNSAAAGASTMTFSGFQTAFPTVLDPLPGNVDFLTAFARFYRTGKESGGIIENFGLKPPLRYYPTLNDTIHNDRDLFNYLGGLLVGKAS